MNGRLSSLSRPGVVFAIALVGAIAIVAAESVVALAVVLLEGSVALAVLASAALAGGWVVRILGLSKQSLADRWILGAGLGIGLLSLIVLALGSAGMLTRPAAILLVVVLAVVGIARLVLDLRQRSVNVSDAGQPARSASEGTSGRYADGIDAGVLREPPESAGSAFRWLWLLVAPFLAIALLAACLPPGVLWREEGFGYDVLEYHLAVPKFFYDSGAITFLPNNVYSNFPLNNEMLSLLMMVIRGGAIEAVYMAQTANVGLACLFVAAAWLAGRSFSPRASMVAALLAATTPWVVYLAGIAYVEAGLLAMGMCSLAALLRAGGDVPRSAPWVLAAGLLAGLACGYKYTAVVLVVVPLALPVVFVRAAWSVRLKRLALFGVAALVPFAPWLVRNLINTHNPVFPLAYSVFGARDGTWDAELEARWLRAHGSAEAERSETSLARRVFGRTLGDERMGVLLFVLAAWGVWAARDRRTAVLAAMLALQFVIWLTATHLFARFAVVLLLPLILLAARAVERPASRVATRLLCGLLVMGAGWNLYRLGALYYHHTRLLVQPAYDQTAWFVEGLWPGTQHVGAINALDERVRVLLVGEARTFYIRRPCEYAVAFNHHPLAMAARQNPDGSALVAWLRDRGITHLLAHWVEIDRLQASYGLEPEIDRELFERLKEAGLRESASFRYEEGRPPYATLFEVPGHE